MIPGSEVRVFIKLSILLMLLIVAILIGVRNVHRRFQPPLRARLELFLAGIPFGIVLMLLIIPEFEAALVFGALAGVLTGIAYAYSAPRQWKFWNEKRNQS